MRLNREMTLMENFCIINYTGFIKILKKHDKVKTKKMHDVSVSTWSVLSSFLFVGWSRLFNMWVYMGVCLRCCGP